MARSISGIGLGLRKPFARDLLATTRRGPDWLEVTPENWVFFGGKLRRTLDAARERFALVPHSVSLSIGGPDALDDALIGAVAKLCEVAQAPFWSDHLCYSTVNGAPLHDLLPLPFTLEAVEHVAARAAEVRRRAGVPLVLENATFYAHMPGAGARGDMDEGEFLLRVVQASECDLLLDVNNVWVNAQNHGFDARAFIDRMPLDRVRQLHVAGHTPKDGVIIDTHIGPIIDPVWDLYRYTLQRAGRLIPTLVEWDQEIPALDVVLDEVDRARAEAEKALGPGADQKGAG
ncbi:MAG: DUF692 domain-containing protein [Deltaproteobacteria bacterium]|nr:DUF692 domain-containing protein [Deltaproteobacteria bacterium]